MKSHGLDMIGNLHVETESTLPEWTSADQRRLIYVSNVNRLYYGGSADWEEVITADEIQTLTNKTINTDTNTITISASDIADNIPASNISTGVVSNTEFDYLDGMLNYPITGDGSGRVLRSTQIRISVSATPGVLIISPTGRFNTDILSYTSGLTAGGSSGDYSLNLSGNTLTILNTGFAGNPVGVLSCNITINSSGVGLSCAGYASANTIGIVFYNSTSGTGQDLTSILTGNETIYVHLAYVTTI